jgi:hypothetical protein
MVSTSAVLGQGSGLQARLARPYRGPAQPGPASGLKRAMGRAHNLYRPIPRAQAWARDLHYYVAYVFTNNMILL